MSDDVGSNPGPLVHPARTAVILVVVAALLLLGLLLVERSGPSPVQHLRSISSGQPAAASATGSAGQSPTLARTNAPQTRLADASISATGKSQITSTGASVESQCASFLAGTATTVSTVPYDTKGSTDTITKVMTSDFLYFVSIPVASAGPQSFTVTQSTTYAPTTGTPFFTQTKGSEALDGSCNPLATTITGGDAAVTVSFTAPTAGTYIIAIKYMTHSIIGSSPASSTPGFSYDYTFSTGGVSGSTQGLSLTHT